VVVNFFIAFIIWISLLGCNHLFYHPSRDYFVEVSELPFKIKTHKVQSTDGVLLDVWVWQTSDKPEALVVQFHGNAENMSSHGFSLAWLVKKHNYALVTFDYRGYGKSSGKPSRQGLVEDGRAILSFFDRDPVLGELDIFVVGQSLGGAVAVPALADKVPLNLAGVILESTFSSYREITRSKLAQFWLSWPLQMPLSYLVSEDFSPVDYISKLSVPVLVIHGSGDQIVPPDSSLRLYEKIESRKSFWKVENGRHLETFRFDFYQNKLVKYLCHLRVRKPCLTM